MSQSASSRQSGAQHNRKNLIFILFVLAAILIALVFFTRSTVDTAYNRLMSSMEQSMSATAQNSAAQMTVWFGGISEQAAQLSRRDQIRLFSSEIARTEVNAEDIRLSSEMANADDNLMFSPGARALTERDMLKAQAPSIRRQFEMFLGGNEHILCVTLLSPEGEAYISTHGEGDSPHTHPNIEAMAALTVSSAAMELGPVRMQGEQLVMDIAVPVVAPLYVDAAGATPVGVLLFACDVTDKIQEVTDVAPQRESTRVLQAAGTSLIEMTLSGTPLLSLPGWTLNGDGALPMAARVLPGRADQSDVEVFSLAVPVPDLPWLVEHDIPVREAMASFLSFRKTVTIGASLAGAIAALVLGMFWWWMLGRRERAVAQEMRVLYDTVNRQKQIIDSVNTTLEDGIVLTDLDGNIPYANQAFASMAEEDTQSVTHKVCAMLGSQEVGQNVINHMAVVRRSGESQTFTELLHVLGRTRHYQVVCTPLLGEVGELHGVVSIYHDISSLVEAQERAQHMVNQTVHVFVRAIEAVDPYLRGQSAQTGVLSAVLAERLGLTDHAATLRTAANLCQVGMIQLPHSLLTKTGALTPEERLQLQKHVEYAHQALDGIDFGLPVVEAIMQMHERLDGSGYPHHLRDDAIHMDGRILAVAATFCAVLRPRSYRQARSIGDAMAILSVTPVQYDPEVVNALRSYLQSAEGQEFLVELTRQ